MGIKGVLETNPWLCTGCRLCELACSLKKEGSPRPSASRIKIVQEPLGVFDIAVVCRLCSDHPCVEACPPKIKALSLDRETGTLTVNHDKCLGSRCNRCGKACRHETAIRFHPDSFKLLLCDLCGGEPACAGVCATGALQYVPATAFDGMHTARSPRTTAREMAVRLGLDTGLEGEGDRT